MTWTERKVAGMCARAGCWREHGEAHNLCDQHAEDHRERQNRSAVERRRFKRAQLALALSNL